jgi:DNA-binding NarL/FixJ family response regulator
MRDGRLLRIVLADRPGQGRTALTRLLADLPGAELVASVVDADELPAVVDSSRADVVIVDDRLLRDQRWTAAELGARVIVVGLDDHPGFSARARRLGAEAWISKDRAGAMLPLQLAHPPAVSR